MRIASRVVRLALLMVATAAVAQQTELEWNWRAQEVINRTDTSVGNTSQLTEPERAELIDDLVLRLQKPMHDAGYEDDRIREIASTTRVRFLDLGDGNRVLFTTSVGLEGGCDAMGNCPFWIFRRTPEGFVSMLDTVAVSYTIQPTSSEGLSDLVLMNRVSAQKSALKLYRASQGKYVEAGCYIALWPPPMRTDSDTQIPDPEIKACDGGTEPGPATPQTRPEEEQAKPANPELQPDTHEAKPAQPEAKPDAAAPAGERQEAPKPETSPSPAEQPKQETPEQTPPAPAPETSPSPSAPPKEQAPEAKPETAQPGQDDGGQPQGGAKGGRVSSDGQSA